MVRKISEWQIKPDKMFSVEGKVVLALGASSGLGQAFALAFDALGAKVILADLNTAGLEETSAEMSGERLLLPVDVTNLDSVQTLVKKSLEKFGRIDVSLNVPGMNIRKPALELTYEEFERVMNLNYMGVFRCAKEVGKVMMDQKKGSMINMSSVFGEITMTRQVAYASTKAAVKQMTRVLAAEWAPYVRCNALAPGYTETALVQQIMTNKDWYDSVRRQIPYERFALPEEIVGPAVFLASDASNYMTGSFLLVDAGWHWFGGRI